MHISRLQEHEIIIFDDPCRRSEISEKTLSSTIEDNTKIGMHLERPKWAVFVIGVVKIVVFSISLPEARGRI